jgi:predicted RNase H-like HicB family nuclease
MVIPMRKISLRILKTSDGDYIASSPESFGFFAMGETREEVLENAREGLEAFLSVEEEFEFEVTEEEEEQSGSTSLS